jgi:hypothetical protein
MSGIDGPSVADELAKLAKLKADGALEDDEFKLAKAGVLGNESFNGSQRGSVRGGVLGHIEDLKRKQQIDDVPQAKFEFDDQGNAILNTTGGGPTEEEVASNAESADGSAHDFMLKQVKEELAMKETELKRLTARPVSERKSKASKTLPLPDVLEATEETTQVTEDGEDDGSNFYAADMAVAGSGRKLNTKNALVSKPKSKGGGDLRNGKCKECGNMLTPDARFCRNCGTPTESGTAELDDFNGKLNRMQFIQRLVLENNMLRTVGAVLLFMPLVVMYVCALLTYDPFELITSMHKTVTKTYNLGALTDDGGVTNRDQLYEYMDTVIARSYERAAVLVDANTLDTINTSYCFGDYDHICKLSYWQTQFDPESVQTKVQFTRRISPLEYPVGNNIRKKVDYPYNMLVPLSPLVFQARGVIEPCDGFGNRYAELMNSTSFTDPSGKEFKVEYLSEPLNCYDMSQTANTVTWAKWNPEAKKFDYNTETSKIFDEAANRDVFYRFVTNTDELKQINWVDAQTKSFTMITVLISPQPAAVQDILTLLQIKIDMNQVGAWKTSVKIFSVSQTMTSWYTLTYLTLAYAVIYALFSSMKLYARWAAKLNYFNQAADVGTSTFMFVSMLWLVIVDKAPPDVFEELIKAFSANSTEQYFVVMGIINSYADVLMTIKQFAFFVTMLVMFRIVLHMSFHPRLGIVADTLAMGIDFLFHFFLAFLVLFSLLGSIGHWLFGDKMEQFETVSRALHTQFEMLTGEFVWVENMHENAAYELYVVVFVILVFFTLTNFFLAIVVNSYSALLEKLEKTESEHNVVVDTLDMIKVGIATFTKGYPWPSEILDLIGGMCAEDGISVIEHDDYWAGLARQPPIDTDELCALSAKASASTGSPPFPTGTMRQYLYAYWVKHPPTRYGMKAYSAKMAMTEQSGNDQDEGASRTAV